MKILIRLTSLVLLWLFANGALANDTLKLVHISDSVKAIVGELSNRNSENLGNNATFGLVISSEGAILIDSGGSHQGAKALHEVIKTVTEQPIKYVINTGGQDHRWFGNEYFQKLGATVISSSAARPDHEARLQSQMMRMESLIGKDKLDGTNPTFADITFDDDHRLTLGDVTLELYYRGQAHTPGDIFVWHPKEKIMFSGDIVYLERMLGIGGQSHSKTWIEAFEAMAEFKPEVVVPGHGSPAPLTKATEDSYNYLTFLREAVETFMDEDGEITDLPDIDQSAFEYLQNYDSLKGSNIQKVFTEMEFE